MADAQASQQQLIQQNNLMRQLLLSSSPFYIKNLGAFSGGVAGSTTRIKLFNVGIITKLLVDVVMTIDIGTAAASLSPKAPFNLIDRIRITDYDGTDRLNLSGYQLWVLNSARRRAPYGYNNESQSAVLTSPVTPTATGNTQTFRFQIEVPLAYNPEQNSALGPNVDLRGAILAQTNVGELYCNITWNPTLYQNANADAVYNGAATTTVALSAGTTITANVTQQYLMPTALPNGQLPLPLLDLLTVYEYTSFKTTDNLSAGQEKLINYPNVRNVISMYANYVNNGVMNPATTDVTKIRLLVNGNNTIREYTATEKLFWQRMDCADGADLRPGTYWEQHRVMPIVTAQYGNVQLGFTPSVVTAGNTSIEVGVEAFYTKNSTLPGINQTA